MLTTESERRSKIKTSPEVEADEEKEEVGDGTGEGYAR